MKRWLLICTLCVASACQREKHERNVPSKREFARMQAEYERLKQAESTVRLKDKSVSVPPTGASAGPPAAANPEPRAEALPEAIRETEGAWTVDLPIDIAPAGPATATRDGIVLYNRDNQVFLARGGALSNRRKRMKTAVARVTGAGRLPLGRGPGVSQRNVYWISSGRLVRRKIDKNGRTGRLEVLRNDAQDGTRVGVPISTGKAPRSARPETVAYIVKPQTQDGPLRAFLWVEGGQARPLTPEGSSTHAVSLVSTGDELLALSLHARMAMTPLHSRRIRFEKDSPIVGEDVVVWVGGGVQSMTELALVADETSLWGFIPHERSISEFGVARLDLSMQPDMNTPTHWILYPNGLDPAPVAAGHLCGEPVILYAQPATAEPGAPQELVVRTIRAPSRAQQLVTAGGFFAVSMQEVPGGALVAYVADWVTWAVSVRCTGAKN